MPQLYVSLLGYKRIYIGRFGSFCNMWPYPFYVPELRAVI